jgi:voltage-gated potassium channel
MLMFFAMRRRKPRKLLRMPNPVRAIQKVAAYLLAVFVLHISAMMVFEAMSFKDAFWLTWTTLTTVGYGDVSAKTWPGRLSTITFIYIGGIFILADFANKMFSFNQWRQERRLNGTWRWKLQDHIVIIGSPDSHPDAFFIRLIEQIRATPDIKDLPIMLLTQSFGGALPEKLRNQNVVHYCGSGVTDDDLKGADIATAKYAILLSANDTDPASDCVTLDILGRLHDSGFLGCSIVECVNDGNRNRAVRLGADAVLRPARGYPEMLIRAMVAPGSEKILENLFDTSGDEVYRVELKTPIFLQWMEVVTKIVGAGAGIPIGFMEAGDNIVTNPSPDSIVNTTTLFVIVNDNDHDNVNTVIEQALQPRLKAA